MGDGVGRFGDAFAFQEPAAFEPVRRDVGFIIKRAVEWEGAAFATAGAMGTGGGDAAGEGLSGGDGAGDGVAAAGGTGDVAAIDAPLISLGGGVTGPGARGGGGGIARVAARLTAAEADLRWREIHRHWPGGAARWGEEGDAVSELHNQRCVYFFTGIFQRGPKSCTARPIIQAWPGRRPSSCRRR